MVLAANPSPKPPSHPPHHLDCQGELAAGEGVGVEAERDALRAEVERLRAEVAAANADRDRQAEVSKSLLRDIEANSPRTGGW